MDRSRCPVHLVSKENLVKSSLRLAVLVATPACLVSIASAMPPIQLQPKAGAPAKGLTAYELGLFNAGRTSFLTPIEAPEGLGPIMNKAGCFSCHAVPLGGWGNITVTRFGVLDKDGHFSNWPGEEQSLRQVLAINESCAEILPEGSHQALRVTNSSMAFGMIEAIPDADIEAVEDPDDLDADGISGRVHWVLPLEAGKGSPLRAGRFGWKAQVATVLTFSGDASRNEMGLTNRLVPTETAPNGNLRLLEQCDDVADPEDHEDVNGFAFIDRVTHFQRYLGVPPQTPKSGMTGETIFNAIGCAKCHIAEWTTSNDESIEEALRGKTIRPYCDFLLHDIGDLADMVSQGDATELEMRTPTLWNLRTRDPMLHDASIGGDTFANRVTATILAHGLFGEGAEVADNFEALSASDQEHLINFLNSLGRLEFDDDGDGHVDVLDALGLEFVCYGATVTPDDHCAVHDIDQDGDVDLADLQYFVLAYEGQNGDCNNNGQPDIIDIILGISQDDDFNGIPDNCTCQGDLDLSGGVDGDDLGSLLGEWGVGGGFGVADFNWDGIVDGDDLGTLLGNWGSCP
ncbi:MAG: hypothetical protein FJ253_07875 [Phycisphaerae bacterium]|nr:hypothetical protein [Phycisphaerae bacterium]